MNIIIHLSTIAHPGIHEECTISEARNLIPGDEQSNLKM